DLLVSMLESSTEHSIVGMDLDGKIVVWNEGSRRLYGYESRDVVAGHHYSLLHVPEDVQAGTPHATLDAVMRNGKWEGDIARLRKDGRRFRARAVITLRRDSAGRPVGFLLISKDIESEAIAVRTEGTHGLPLDPSSTSPELRESEELFRGSFEHTNVATVLTDLDNRFLRPNAAFGRLFGYSPEEMVGMSVADVTHPDDLAGSYERRLELIAGRATHVHMEKRYRHRNGDVFWGLTNIALVRDSQGQPLRYVGQIQDISERKRAEEA